MSERLSTVKTTLKPHFQVSPRFYTAAVEQLGIIRVIVLRLPDTEIWEWPGDKALHCHAGLQERSFFLQNQWHSNETTFPCLLVIHEV